MTLAALIIEFLRARFEPIRRLVDTIFGFMMRPEEIPPVPAPVRFNGATWVLLTSTLLVALFEPTIAAAAIAIGLLGDAAAAIVGRRFGRMHIGKSDKTIEGSMAFLLVAAPLIWIVPNLTLPVGLAGVVAGVVVESLHLPINDNFSVPMASALAMTFLFL
jgi:dolichol kinase